VTIDRVLRLLYPTVAPDLSDLASLRDVCATLDKYCMRAFPVPVTDSLFRAAQTHPEVVYALGCRHALPRVREAAARASLRVPRSLAALSAADAHFVSGAQRVALARFQQEAIARAVEAASCLTWVHMSKIPGVPSMRIHPPSCICKRKPVRALAGNAAFEDAYVAEVLVPEWCLDYMDSISQGLRHGAFATGRAAMNPAVFEYAMGAAAGCAFCGDSARAKLLPFALALEAEVDRRVAMVS
jgi:hypothetical protein